MLHKSVLVSVVARFMNIGVTLLSMPIMLHRYGEESFGIWMTVTGIVGFLTFVDFGVGAGLQNKISKFCAVNKRSAARAYISTSYLFMGGMVLVMTVLGLIFINLIPIGLLVKISDVESAKLVVRVLSAVYVALMVNVISGLVSRLLMGMQLTYISSYLLMYGRILGLLFVFASVNWGWPLVVVSALYAGAPGIVGIVYTPVFFAKNADWIPRLEFFKFSVAKELVADGFLVVLAQLTAGLRMNMPVWVLASGVGLAAVSSFSTNQRVFTLFGILLSMGMQNLWPAYSDAYHKKDYKWIFLCMKRVWLLTSISFIFILPLSMIFGKKAVFLWLGNESMLPSASLILGLTLWSWVSCYCVSYAVLLNAMGRFLGQASVGLLVVILSGVFIKIWGASYGVECVVWCFFVSEVIRTTTLFVEFRFAKKYLGNGSSLPC